jgi:hypothetical protein
LWVAAERKNFRGKILWDFGCGLQLKEKRNSERNFFELWVAAESKTFRILHFKFSRNSRNCVHLQQVFCFSFFGAFGFMTCDEEGVWVFLLDLQVFVVVVCALDLI